ncbi:hypothetical protein BABINDRAFT_160207 [Babjeviella inositovora NRRL Y-12698]|uniref:Ribosomal RNA-processing protein 43 n=1 Tax=Babjeviella inositovora NRRL Y-12698 TaxID=984486 RepID=A0A1E3QWW1_9ASCO|nr:uncharacterized protein BABINDRAFT_160207 [Babjeviella inositovora NRRL Y-12698]ODQ81994.1 hypothetical protein BABINDRAFT_160207 [Babjeviella inositovora NRRL Y-12698]
MSETDSGLRPMAFAPDILARIAPELSLQRHLAIGLRPSLRNFHEFRPVQTGDGGLSRYTSSSQNDSPVLGSAVLKSGNTTVICGITAGIVEEKLSEQALAEAASVYPVVEIARGRMGAPTDEEMILSQKLFETVHHAGVLQKAALKVNVGIRSQNSDGTSEVFYPDQNSEDDLMFKPSREWSFVLYAHFQVFSREGPMFDLCWGALVKALQATQLPYAYIDERIADIKVPIRSRGHFGTVRENYMLACDYARSQPLEIAGKCGWSSSFGVVDAHSEESGDMSGDIQMDESAVLLADLQGEAEETNVVSRITVVTAGELLHNVSIVGGGATITKQFLKQAIEVSRRRAADLLA